MWKMCRKIRRISSTMDIWKKNIINIYDKETQPIQKLQGKRFVYTRRLLHLLLGI